MRGRISPTLPVLLTLAIPIALYAQDNNPTASQSQPQPVQIGDSNTPLYRIQVVARDIPAVNYFHRSGSTKIDFQGTSLMPNARGSAKVEVHAGRTTINWNAEGFTPAMALGLSI